MKKILVALLCLTLTACGTFQPAEDAAVDVLTSPTTFAVCKAADVATTAIGLNSGHFVEANPALKVFIGPHNFGPLILFSIAAYFIIKNIDDKRFTAAANVITCGVVGHNLHLEYRAGLIK